MKIGRETVQRSGRGGGGWIVALLLGLAALLIVGGLAPRLLDDFSFESDPVSLDQPSAQAGEKSKPEEAAPEAEAADLPEAVPEEEVPGQAAPEQAASAQASPEELQAMADAYYAALDARDLNAALRHATAYMRAAPDDPYGYALRGYAHWLRGRCDSAIGDLDKAIALSPDYGYAYFARGSCRFSLVRLDDAAADAAAAVVHAQSREEAGHALDLQGWIAYARGRFEEAGEAFRQAAAAFAEAGQGAGMGGAGMWLSFTRAGAPPGGELDTQGLDATQTLVLNVLDGRRPRSDLEARAQDGGLAAFYLAQIALAEGRNEDARDLLETYTRRGFSTDIERSVARVQLVALR